MARSQNLSIKIMKGLNKENLNFSNKITNSKHVGHLKRKRFEISDLDLIREMDDIVMLEKVFINF